MKYVLIDQILYWRDPSGMFLRCLDRFESSLFNIQLQEDACGGHKYWKATSFKILRAGYYQTTLFTYVYTSVKSCMQCQKFVGKQKIQSFPLKPISINAPF